MPFILLIVFCLFADLSSGQTARQKAPAPPVYKVDASWPKTPLPNKWMMQGVPTMVTDHNDHIWVLTRPRDITPDESGASKTPPRNDCCVAPPAVLEFDTQGNLLRSWGKPEYVPGWPAPGVDRPGPQAEHAIVVDKQGNVWISGAARGDGIQKFTGDGKFLWDFGHRGQGITEEQRRKAPPGAFGAELLAAFPLKQDNQNTDILPTGVEAFDLDEDAQELYVVDGLLNKRILVYDMNTGVFKRGWGGHGVPLSEITNDPVPDYDWKSGALPDQKEFAPALHCVHISVDGLVYVCERGSNRIQVFTKQGKFVTSFFVYPQSPARGKECGGNFGGCGNPYNLTFSHDPEEKYILVVDGNNNKIWIHDRKTGEMVGSVGCYGAMAGQFHVIDAIAMDSLGNLYTGEVGSGKRVQKFVLTNGDGKRRPRAHE
jgi:hypothetical protein